MAASAGALALGFATYDRDVRVAGVILNRWNPRRSQGAVEAALVRAGVEVLGYVPAAEHLELPSRHLGLVVADELSAEVEAVMDRLAANVEEHVDVDRVLALAGEVPARSGHRSRARAQPPRRRRQATMPRPLLWLLRAAAPASPWPGTMPLPSAARTTSPCCESTAPSSISAAATPSCMPAGSAPTRSCAIGWPRRLRTACLSTSVAVCSTCAACLRTWTAAPGRRSAPCPVTLPCTTGCRGWATGRRAWPETACPGATVRGHKFHYSSCVLENDNHPACLHEESPEGYAAGDLFPSYIHPHSGYPALLEHWLERCPMYAARQGGPPT